MAEISEKLRSLRKSRKMTLKDVAEKAGCTSAYISQLEKGRANPSIATLKRIASVFNVKIIDFFLDNEDEKDEVVVRKDQRMTMGVNMSGTSIESLVRGTEHKRMQALYNRIRPGGGSNGEYTHEGEEFGMVLAGELEITVADNVYHLREGDSFYFPSSKAHSFYNRGKRETLVIWVASPPSF